jgi:hypothetical protein
MKVHVRRPQAPARRRDLAQSPVVADLPQRRRRTVAEHSASAACKDGCHPDAVGRQRSVSHRIHPAMDAVEPTRKDAAADGRLGQPEGEKLFDRNDAVLAARKSGDQHIRARWSL